MRTNDYDYLMNFTRLQPTQLLLHVYYYRYYGSIILYWGYGVLRQILKSETLLKTDEVLRGWISERRRAGEKTKRL